MLNFEFKADQAMKAMAAGSAAVTRAIFRALNRAGAHGHTTLASLVAKDMGLKVRDAKNEIRLRQATADRLQIRLSADLRRLPLSKFGARGPLPSLGRGRGVSYRIGNRGAQRLPHAFLARMGNSHQGVFRRVGKARLPIIQLYGPSIGRVFDHHQPAALTAIRETFATRLTHELKFAFRESANTGTIL
jgi:hypothetical protein